MLAACTNTNSETDKITVAKVTDREKTILSTMAEKSFVFDFHVDSEYEEVSLWMEKYEAGQLVETDFGELTAMIKEEGSIVWTTLSNPNSSEKMFYLGVGDDSGSSSVMSIDDEAEKIADLASVWNDFSDTITVTEKAMVIAGIGFSSEESGLNSFTRSFFNNFESHQDELEQFDVAYVLKVEFKR